LNLKEGFLFHPVGLFMFIMFFAVTLDAMSGAFFKRSIAVDFSKRESLIIAVGFGIITLAHWIIRIIL